MDLAARILEGQQVDLADLVAETKARQQEATEAIRRAKEAQQEHNLTVAAFGPKSREAAETRAAFDATKTSDRYFTSAEILALIAAQFGEIDLDPCHDEDPGCIVTAKATFNIRRGEDGTLLPWHGKVFLNPPFSNVEPWLRRSVMHAGGGEVLAIVGAATGTAAWVGYVWPYALACFLHPRPKFMKFGASKPTYHPAECAVLYYGPHRQRFREVWSSRGPIVGLVRET